MAAARERNQVLAELRHWVPLLLSIPLSSFLVLRLARAGAASRKSKIAAAAAATAAAAAAAASETKWFLLVTERS